VEVVSSGGVGGCREAGAGGHSVAERSSGVVGGCSEAGVAGQSVGACSSGGAGESSEAGAAGQPVGASPSGGAGGSSEAGAAGQSVGASPSGGAGGTSPFQVEVHLASEESPKAPSTVGIVTWSSLQGEPSAASIEFGLTTDYGMSAPVDADSGDLRTVLVGMKPERTYHFRIVAEVGAESLVSEDYTLTTGSAPDASVLSPVDFQVLLDEEREPGFIITSYWNNQSQSGMVFILDSDGDIVWWYDSEIDIGVGKAAMSDDGRDLWMINGAASQNDPLRRVGMDGLNPQTYTSVNGSHDIVPVEGSVMAFVALFTAAEVDRSGPLQTILPPLEINTIPPPHINALAYNKTLATYLVSNLTEDVYIFPRAGATPETTTLLTSIIGPNSGWGGAQHGVQLLSNNHLLLFANQESNDPTASTAIEYDLDTGQEVWRYESDHYSGNFGNVQRLPNGNTLVNYSNVGVIHEVTADGVKVLEITTNPYLGYASWRPDLYRPLDDAAE
jgi:hypothetical protein